jgi:hypothetical protein
MGSSCNMAAALHASVRLCACACATVQPLLASEKELVVTIMTKHLARLLRVASHLHVLDSAVYAIQVHRNPPVGCLRFRVSVGVLATKGHPASSNVC